MTLVAFGPAIDTEPIVTVEVDDAGYLTVSLEREDGIETHRVAPAGVSLDVRALSSTEEAA